jgi:hypothetical protein
LAAGYVQEVFIEEGWVEGMSTKDFDSRTREASEKYSTQEVSEFESKRQHDVVQRAFTSGATLRKPEWEKVCRVLEVISRRPNLPNPERDADWKNCMKCSSHECRELIAELKAAGSWIEGKDE